MTWRGRPHAILLYAACAAAALAAIAGAHVRAAEALPRNLVLHNAPEPVAAITFTDQHGTIRSLAAFKDKVVVLNFWATWCVPCRKEMPTLDRLQAALGGPSFEVVPVSVDLGGIDKVRKFYAGIGLRNLAMYVDSSGQALRAVGAFGLPTTLILDRQGREVGRIVGPAEWDSVEMMDFLKPVIAQHNNGTAQAERSQVADANRPTPGVFQRGLQWLKAVLGK